jgi:hypothetical protein
MFKLNRIPSNLIWIYPLFPLFFACSDNITVNHLDTESLLPDTLIRVSDWYIIAPFQADTTIPTLQRQEQDFLEVSGKQENEFKSIEDFFLLCKIIQSVPYTR